ncbi:MAG: hypothetical protein VB140_02955 [Burkholderia sp.]
MRVNVNGSRSIYATTLIDGIISGDAIASSHSIYATTPSLAPCLRIAESETSSGSSV